MTIVTSRHENTATEVPVPIGVYSIDFELDGAGGGAGGTDTGGFQGGKGGNGAKVTGTIAVEPGQVLKLYLGSGGTRGTSHASNGGGGGGGAWAALYLDDDLVAIAGGGGGGGGGLGNASDNNGYGGDGGGPPSGSWRGDNGYSLLGSGPGWGGQNGVGGQAAPAGGGGTAGTQYNGGNGGPSAAATGGLGRYPGGDRGNGGQGGVEGSGTTIAGAGGGGGGWGGGGGGGLSYWGGGGGGGSYANPALVTNAAAVKGGGAEGGARDLDEPTFGHGQPAAASLTWDVQTPTNIWLEPKITETFADGETATLTWDTAELFESLFGVSEYPAEAIILYEADVIVFDGDDIHMSIATLTQRISHEDYQRNTISMARNVVGFEVNEEDEEGDYIVARFQGTQPANNMVITITPRLGATSMRVAISPRLIGFLPS